VLRFSLALATLCAGIASGAGPSYSADSIVNASDFSPGPFAPDSVLSIFGTGLAWSTQAIGPSDIRGGLLPTELNSVHVYVQDQPAPILFVSSGQINFIIPSIQSPGTVRVRVVNNGLSGPEVQVTLVSSAPALFSLPNGYCIATSSTGDLLTADTPAHANDTVVVYATGLGWTNPNPGFAVIPTFAAQVTALSSLKVALNGTVLDPVRIKYAGLTPGSAGLYQINLVLPDGTGPDPEIRVSADMVPGTALKLPLH
jgi:uncharacterized protein (TIGR03437 family)